MEVPTRKNTAVTQVVQAAKYKCLLIHMGSEQILAVHVHQISTVSFK